MPARNCPLIGKWRTVEMELWDTDLPGIIEPAYFAFEAKGGGEFVFGAVRGGLDCRCGRDGVGFTWRGYDGMDPASGAGTAMLDETGALTGGIRFHPGDESTLEARRW